MTAGKEKGAPVSVAMSMQGDRAVKNDAIGRGCLAKTSKQWPARVVSDKRHFLAQSGQTRETGFKSNRYNRTLWPILRLYVSTADMPQQEGVRAEPSL